MINQCIYGSVSAEHQPTVGIDFFAKAYNIDNKVVRVQIWDTAGQEKFHSLIPSYIRPSTVTVLCYDITSRSSFEGLDRWFKMVTEIANPQFFVVGNKVDLEDQRVVSTEEGQKFAEAHQTQFIETSARTATNINELFDRIAHINLNQATTTPKSAEEAPAPLDGKQLAEQPNAQSGGSSCC
ncbi:Ras family protein [Tritrichomonas foetus]|uniref:Ras family protein n=1 Tax=Tritrichomonas foetus TaxID=1144522 RepID=A0A1J4KZZ8_9EUKA|nr:Ras family protein [Tritrichomonas foetus]|eukprot:OHT16833.1 Ras family protein [Tritrichomonas foetus]